MTDMKPTKVKPSRAEEDRLHREEIARKLRRLRAETLAREAKRRGDDAGVCRKTSNANKTHCPVGHPYDRENTRWSRGKRYCRTCGRARYHGRKKGAA
jgi:hypothetical protein